MVITATFWERGSWGSSSPTARHGMPLRPSASRICRRWARVRLSTAMSPKPTSPALGLAAAAAVHGKVARAADDPLEAHHDLLGLAGRGGAGDQLHRRPVPARPEAGRAATSDGCAAARIWSVEPVAGLEPHLGGARVGVGEAGEVAGPGAAKAVDRLVRIADGAQAGAARRQQRDERGLDVVDVLVLVDADRRQRARQLRRRRRVGGEQLIRPQHQVVDVDGAPLLEQLLVALRSPAAARGSPASTAQGRTSAWRG